MEYTQEHGACLEQTQKYCVERPIYNQEILQGQLRRRDRTPQTLRQKIAHSCRCSSKKAKSYLYSFLPILKWLPSYPVKEYLLGDIISGISTGVMQLPQEATGLSCNIVVGNDLHRGNKSSLCNNNASLWNFYEFSWKLYTQQNQALKQHQTL